MQCRRNVMAVEGRAFPSGIPRQHYSGRTRMPVAPLGLLYRVLRRVALARVHHDFYVLTLLVANL